MHILYFGCLTTNILDFYKHTTLRCYVYPTKGMVMCHWLFRLHDQNTVHFNCLQLFDINFLKSDISWKHDCLSFVSMVTVEDSGTLLFPIGYRQIACAYTSIRTKINYTSQSVAMVTIYSKLSTRVCLVF